MHPLFEYLVGGSTPLAEGGGGVHTTYRLQETKVLELM